MLSATEISLWVLDPRPSNPYRLTITTFSRGVRILSIAS